MSHQNPHERQDRRDIERAQTAIAHESGLNAAHGVRILNDRAADAGISVHAAALAALSSVPRDER